VTAPEWRDCADPDELAAAVAAGVEVQWERYDGWVPSANQTADQFAGSLRAGITYQLPASWSWRPEPPAPDEVAAPDDDWCEAVLNDLNSIIHGHCGSDGSDDAHCDWVNDLANEVVRYFQRQDVLAVLPTPPVPPWPGAVLSGLVDEDGVPTWLAQAGQVRGEQVRACTSVPWLPNTSYGEDEWVEVRAPRAVPEPETERVAEALATEWRKRADRLARWARGPAPQDADRVQFWLGAAEAFREAAIEVLKDGDR
jgi:hypothetical protein